MSCFAQLEISYLKDEQKILRKEDILKVKFSPLPDNQFNIGTDSSYHWLKFDIKSATTQKMFIEINSPWLDSVWYYNSNMELIKKMSWKTPLKDRPFPHQNFILPITANKNDIFYAKIYRKYLVIIGGASVENEENFYEKKISEKSYFSIFSGIMVLATIFALFMYFSNYEKLYFYYAIYAVSNLLFVQTLYANYLPIYQKGFVGIPGFQIDEVFVWVVHFALLFFIKCFILGGWHFTKFISFLWKITLISLFLILPLKAIFFYLLVQNIEVPSFVFTLTNFLFLFLAIVSYFLVIYALSKKINPAASIIYLIGICPLFVFSIFTYLRNLTLVQHSRWLEYETQIVCVLFEILILMLGLGIRYKLLKKESEVFQYKLSQSKVETAHEVLTAQEDERQRIAKDLHDDIGGTLSVLKGLLSLKGIDSQEISLIDKASNDLRNISHDLMPSDFERFGLIKSIENQIDKINQAKQIQFDFLVSGEIKAQNLEHELTIYRMANELINNVIRHAKATEATLQLLYMPDNLHLIVEDTGVGFHSNQQENEGIGIKNLYSRAKYIEAKINIDSSEKGTIFVIEIPYKKP